MVCEEEWLRSQRPVSHKRVKNGLSAEMEVGSVQHSQKTCPRRVSDNRI